ncbi:beta-ketoacyl [acyl carrier protein] synthase domain-containing protein [Streptomyces sp. NPDC003006]
MPEQNVCPQEEPLAIVGAACRLPGGVNDLQSLWSVLEQGRDLVTEAPPERFESDRFLDRRGRPGKTRTTAGGFLENIADFDADFFDIAPREASRMDPRQRLLLEMTVEALDDAGISREALAGSDTGVFIGVSGQDYLDLQTARIDTVNPYTMTGGSGAVTANRISYVLDWHGESVAVDTACSSALTAVHQACEYLRSGRGRAVLAGSAHVLLNPSAYVGFSTASMLSPAGRCRTFSNGADGYVRAEGGGVVLLKRLSDALADGDRVHGTILASGANSDGRTAGLALPSDAAQEALLRAVHARAGIGADDLAYLEMHGTGTSAGDQAECRAVGWALGALRTCGPLPVGSVKSNLGQPLLCPQVGHGAAESDRCLAQPRIGRGSRPSGAQTLESFPATVAGGSDEADTGDRDRRTFHETGAAPASTGPSWRRRWSRTWSTVLSGVHSSRPVLSVRSMQTASSSNSTESSPRVLKLMSWLTDSGSMSNLECRRSSMSA